MPTLPFPPSVVGAGFPRPGGETPPPAAGGVARPSGRFPCKSGKKWLTLDNKAGQRQLFSKLETRNRATQSRAGSLCHCRPYKRLPQMGKFFDRFKPDPPEASISTWGNLTSFYSLLVFLIAIPFILIVLLVWLTSFLGMSSWLFAGFAVLCAYIGWRLYRWWRTAMNRMTAQGSEFHDLMRDAARNGKNMEISLLNGAFTLRYHGAGNLAAALPGRPRSLALAGPLTLEADAEEMHPWLPPERLREELEGFVRLRDEGVISAEEFDRLKASLLQRVSA